MPGRITVESSDEELDLFVYLFLKNDTYQIVSTYYSLERVKDFHIAYSRTLRDITRHYATLHYATNCSSKQRHQNKKG